MHPLESRSGPNQRLVRVFGIDNAFTTTKEEYWKEFRKSVERQMRISEERWEGLAHTAQELVHRGVGARTSDERDGILLVPFMQTAVLKFSLHVFFPVRVDELEDEVLSTIADKINRLWIGSKGSKHTDSMRSDQRVLMAALRKILPGYGETMRTNPLNIIMPAYETMWRVVLRGFLEVGFRSGHRGQIWRQVMDEFLLNPSRATFDTITPGVYGVSPAFIVDETLRLYPPTRRIYRHKQDGVDDTPDVVAADIEHLHRDPDIWGQDSMLFRPSRWASLSEDRRSAFIPFGAGHFTCPAKRDAGPRMVGILMAALLGVFDMGWECEAINPEDEIDGNDPLNSGRDSYTTLRIRRVVP
ncbi:hypothetical protein MMC16_002070 [Acarospora aff. strigata]|nr:hypothetical protein [Acarospora aff. strigata]